MLYKASQDDYLFWIASSRFVYRAVPYYLKLTTGISHIPIVKEDIKNKDLTEKEKKEVKKLKREILANAIKLEKLHEIWLSEYYLSLAYLFNDNLKKAKLHVRKALAMNPNPQYLWNLWHFINVKYASLKTGKPISYFLPSKKEIEKMHQQLNSLIKEVKKKKD